MKLFTTCLTIFIVILGVLLGTQAHEVPEDEIIPFDKSIVQQLVAEGFSTTLVLDEFSGKFTLEGKTMRLSIISEELQIYIDDKVGTLIFMKNDKDEEMCFITPHDHEQKTGDTSLDDVMSALKHIEFNLEDEKYEHNGEQCDSYVFDFDTKMEVTDQSALLNSMMGETPDHMAGRLVVCDMAPALLEFGEGSSVDTVKELQSMKFEEFGELDESLLELPPYDDCEEQDTSNLVGNPDVQEVMQILKEAGIDLKSFSKGAKTNQQAALAQMQSKLKRLPSAKQQRLQQLAQKLSAEGGNPMQDIMSGKSSGNPKKKQSAFDSLKAKASLKKSRNEL